MLEFVFCKFTYVLDCVLSLRRGLKGCPVQFEVYTCFLFLAIQLKF